LPPRQKAVLDAIEEFQRTHHGIPPTLQELGDMVGVTAQTISEHMKALERKGYIARMQSKARGYISTALPREGRMKKYKEGATEVAASIPILGKVPAGVPLSAVEDIEGTVPVPQELARRGKLFALRVRGDSMVGEGILDGDIAIIRQQSAADSGDVVVAIVEGMAEPEGTLKRYRPQKGGVILEPANPAYEPILLWDPKSLQIVGKLVGLVRTLPF
jgi:repressor LexA